jgi:hypothetical protein
VPRTQQKNRVKKQWTEKNRENFPHGKKLGKKPGFLPGFPRIWQNRVKKPAFLYFLPGFFHIPF